MAVKIEAYGVFAFNDFQPNNPEEWNGDKQSMPNCEAKITIEKWTGGKVKKLRGYYWAVLVPHTLIILTKVCGYAEWLTKSTDDAHEFLKYMFNPVYVPDPENPEQAIRIPGSTKGKKMSRDQRIEYIDKIITYAQNVFNYTYPPPIKKADKYEFD